MHVTVPALVVPAIVVLVLLGLRSLGGHAARGTGHVAVTAALGWVVALCGGGPSTTAARAGPITSAATAISAGSPAATSRPTVYLFVTTKGCASCEQAAHDLEVLHSQIGDRVGMYAVELAPGISGNDLKGFAAALGLH